MSDWPKSTLHDHPNVAQRVGLVVADYALLEMMMFMLYAVVSGLHGMEAFKRFYRLRSIHLREEITYKAAEGLEEAYQEAICRAWKRFKAAANRRTEIAHCSFMSDGKTVTRLRMFGTEPRFEPMNKQVFDRTFTQYRTLGKDLIVLVSEIAPDPDAVQKLLAETPFGQYRQSELVYLGSLDPQARYGEREVRESLARLRLLDHLYQKWRLRNPGSAIGMFEKPGP
jgi:hypothetical protein